MDLLRTYGDDYKVIFVGDASMSPYEISMPGGSVEHHNEEPGATWLKRCLRQWPHADLAEPRARVLVALHRLDRHDPRADGEAHVPADARGHRSRA